MKWIDMGRRSIARGIVRLEVRYHQDKWFSDIYPLEKHDGPFQGREEAKAHAKRQARGLLEEALQQVEQLNS